ncbi:MAG TPA: hypothetical protein VKE51_36150 [Vicinamibacterales bacterium]|nr:hypothetical protein [Vicinamibacterales bacterium]
MNRTAAGLCVATAMACAVSLGAQTPTTTTTPQRSSTTTEKSHDVTVTGCLARDASGGYILNDARIDPAASSTTTAPGSTTTAGATTTAPPSASTSSAPPMKWMLRGDSDLDKHVGEKVQVSGKTTWDSAMSRAASGATTTTAQPDPTTTAGTTGTVEQRRGERDTKGAEPRLDVQSIKMIASHCS